MNKSPIDEIIDAAFSILPERYWLTYNDSRLLTARASKEFAGKVSIGNFKVGYMQSKLPKDWREEFYHG